MKAAVLLLALLSGASLPMDGQGFINFGFNEPDLSNLPPRVPGGFAMPDATANLLPGWSLTADGVPRDTMVYAFFGSTGTGPGLSLVDSAVLGSPNDGRGPYYLYVRTHHDPFDPRRGLDVRLSQRGTVPENAERLEFIDQSSLAQVWIDDQKVDVTGVGYRSISLTPFAGRNIDLEFRFYPNLGTQFDIIGFVPEPEAVALFAVGGAAVALQVYRKRRRR